METNANGAWDIGELLGALLKLYETFHWKKTLSQEQIFNCRHSVTLILIRARNTILSDGKCPSDKCMNDQCLSLHALKKMIHILS